MWCPNAPYHVSLQKPYEGHKNNNKLKFHRNVSMVIKNQDVVSLREIQDKSSFCN